MESTGSGLLLMGLLGNAANSRSDTIGLGLALPYLLTDLDIVIRYVGVEKVAQNRYAFM
jgi:hypothetical protein